MTSQRFSSRVIRMRTQTSNNDFDEFVRRQQESSASAGDVDWEKERDEWLRYLEVLYEKVNNFLSGYVASGQIRLEYETVRLDEEHIGSYAAKQMVIGIGRQKVSLVPIGTLLVGAKGRVDVIGPAGRAAILLVDHKAPGAASVIFDVKVGTGGKPRAPSELPKATNVQWEWKIVSRPPERRFIEITQQSLFDLIIEVANG